MPNSAVTVGAAGKAGIAQAIGGHKVGPTLGGAHLKTKRTKTKPKRRLPKPKPLEYGDVLRYAGVPVYVLGIDESKVYCSKPFKWGVRVLTLDIPEAYQCRLLNTKYQPEPQDVH